MKKLEKYRKLPYIFLQIFLKKNAENAPNFDAKNTAKFTSHFALFFAYEFDAYRTVFAYEFDAFRTVFCI